MIVVGLVGSTSKSRRALAKQYGVHVNEVWEKFHALDVKTAGKVGIATR